MSIAGGIVIYIIVWWVVLFTVLPIGVRNPYETGEDMVPGQADGAPSRPRLLFKFLLTTAITTGLFVALWASDHFNIINWRELFDPKS
ncbi:MAG: DUF1467 family protein [Minwuia sp.]|nr:DUF1467 family protein [Minwuia sp.]